MINAGDKAGPDETTEKLDETDHAILRLLQRDGRTPYRQIAREVGVSEGTVRFRVNRLLESGTLRVIAITDPYQLGYRVLAFSLLKVAPEAHKKVVKTLSEWDEITYVSSCAGHADLYVQLVCRDHEHLWDLLYERIPAIGGITEVETFLEIKMHKVSYGYPIPDIEETGD